jgi:uncharacterized protein YndB with AHSA1/START domain
LIPQLPDESFDSQDIKGGDEMNPHDTDMLNREVITTRVFDARRELVVRAWTDPEQLVRWWGPNGFTNTFHQFDLRPGGTWRFTMHGSNGADYPNETVFEEIAGPERLRWKHISAPQFQVAVLFDELRGGRTKVTYRMLFEAADTCQKLRALIVPSNEELFDRLAAQLDGMH